jgi:hypothetical protein
MRPIVLYAALVGLPLLGILLVLQVGRGLTAPPSFGGTWRLATATYPDGCTPPSVLRVEQSGARARVGLGAGTVWGAVTEGSFRTLAPAEGPGEGCEGWHVQAEASGGATPTQLTGRLVPAGCACAPVPFRAERAATGRAAAH